MIKPTLVRAGLEAVEKHLELLPECVKTIQSDLEGDWTERELAMLIATQCEDLRGALRAALRAVNAIDNDVQRVLTETDPKS